MSDAEPAPENAEPSDAGTDATEQLGDAGKKALDAMKAELKVARTEAREAKKLRTELDELRAATLTESEKAIEQARKEGIVSGTQEAAVRYGSRLVDAEVKAASAGRNIDVDTLLEGLDRTRFLGDDGEVDTPAVAAWVDKLAPKTEVSVFPDLGQGARTNDDSMALNGDPLFQDLKQKLGIR